ncbi:MAG: penicillin-binding protein 2 [Bacteroidales bacterium]
MYRRQYSERKYLFYVLAGVISLIFLIRLFWLQVIDTRYILSAENNVLRKNVLYPGRGLIYDRHGKLLVYDEGAYDLMVIPGQLRSFDTLELSRLLDIDPEILKEKITRARKYSTYKPSLLVGQISKEDFGYLEERLYRFPGLYPRLRSIRKYPDSIAAHLLGYVGEVDESELAADPYYQIGDYIGKSGVERHYEKMLRGQKGIEVVMVDVHNRVVGSYRNGRYDTLPEPGRNLYLTLDAGLQSYAEKLMINKIGSVVAIEPATGDILAFVSSPAYDPNLLVGRPRSQNFQKLSQDSLKPLLNRPVMGTYPPGSTFKLVDALIGLSDGVIRPSTTFVCNGPASLPIRCTHNHKSPLALEEAIEQSCNPYFWNVFRTILENPAYPSVRDSYEAWYSKVTGMGFGHTLSVDIPFEKAGSVPPAQLFDKIYQPGHWNALTVRSLAIGQGELLVTPLQLANLAALIANRGWYIAPHTVRAIDGMDHLLDWQEYKKEIAVKLKDFDVVQNAMLDVFEGEHGTARWARLEGVRICGKTGTVQNPHGKDHSLFIAFAPMEKPVIALSVVVENSGYGSVWAAPIASLLIEQYLNDTITRPWIEKRIVEGNLIPE